MSFRTERPLVFAHSRASGKPGKTYRRQAPAPPLVRGGTDEESEIFAANRASGRVSVSVAAVPGGASRRGRVHEAGALRVRFPNAQSRNTLEAVIVNSAGGMTGGDRFAIDILVGDDARLSVTTAAAEKVYRTLGPDSELAIKLSVGAGGGLAWLPQETILFDRMRLRRRIDVDLAPGAELTIAEAVVFGRSAMGESVSSGAFFDRWRVRLGGNLVFAETTRLDGDIAQCLAQRAAAAGGVGLASVFKLPGHETTVSRVRSMGTDRAGEVGISAWNGFALARLVAPNGAALRRDLIAVLTALGAPLPRLWTN